MKYVALLRGIGPGNPNMTGESFTRFFTELGFKKVHPVIASGNVVFESASTNATLLEEKIEKELPKKLGFSRTVIVRSEKELLDLIDKKPYNGIEDKKPNYFLVTFFKDRQPELCAVVNLDMIEATKYMTDIERKYGKEITSRTWKTVNRILAKMKATS